MVVSASWFGEIEKLFIYRKNIPVFEEVRRVEIQSTGDPPLSEAFPH
jgi:hypothetical protein